MLRDIRGGPHLSSFSLMIIPIVRGGRGLKNDDKYHKLPITKESILMHEKNIKNVFLNSLKIYFVTNTCFLFILILVYKMMMISYGEGGSVKPLNPIPQPKSKISITSQSRCVEIIYILPSFSSEY